MHSPGDSCRALTKVVEEQTERGVQLDLVLTNKEGLVEDMKAVRSLWSSGSFEVGPEQQAGSQFQSSEGLNLASLRICLEKSHGIEC